MTRRALIGSIALIAVVVTGCLAVDDQTTTSPADSVPDQAEAPESSTSSAPVATTIASSTSTTTTVPTTTSVPTTTTATTTTVTITTTTLVDIGALEAGLFCRDLAGLGYDYSAAVAYWTREGRPDRMDADRNGIPCETVYDSAMVVAFWGDPLPRLRHPLRPSGTGWSRPSIKCLHSRGLDPSTVRGAHRAATGFRTASGSATSTGPTTRPSSSISCASGPGPEGPGDITNSNPKLRTVPVAGEQPFIGSWLMESWCGPRLPIQPGLWLRQILPCVRPKDVVWCGSTSTKAMSPKSWSCSSHEPQGIETAQGDVQGAGVVAMPKAVVAIVLAAPLVGCTTAVDSTTSTSSSNIPAAEPTLTSTTTSQQPRQQHVRPRRPRARPRHWRVHRISRCSIPSTVPR